MLKTIVIVIIGIVMMVVGLSYLIEVDTNNKTQVLIKITEEAYFEGQRDALEGDIRIGKDSEGNYYWTQSPWDDGTQPIFQPYNTQY